MPTHSPVIAVLGPTASGKTEVALGLAQLFTGEIISCDSVQIYQDLNIGSAKPSEIELRTVPHHLINLFQPNFQMDVGIYKSHAESSIQDIQNRHRCPLICGGTGMYFNALYYGLFDAPGRSDELRAELEQKADQEGLVPLQEELKMVDPEAYAKIMPNDKRRIVRALEIYRLTGKSLSAYQKDNHKLDLKWILIGLSPDRTVLYQRIEDRIDRMLRDGLIEETRDIINRFGKDAYALGSIGYRHARNYIDGVWNYEEMIYQLKLDTRHYAKRQLTWFRKIPEIRWFDSAEKDSIARYCQDSLHSEDRS